MGSIITFINSDNENTFSGNYSSVLGDIDNDGKQELFVTTGEEELSVLYFE
jgi:hypothetical protein